MSTEQLSQDQAVRARKFFGETLRTDDGAAIARTFSTWSAMLGRCFVPGALGYEHYSGRGISVCEQWFTFAGFVADMGLRPDGLTLDRIDNDGDYEPGNCRWATKSQQARNTRRNRVVGGVLQVEAAEQSGVLASTISRRIAAGYSAADALNGNKIVKVKLNKEDALCIKERLRLGHSHSAIATDFGVSRQMVGGIKSGLYWGDA